MSVVVFIFLSRQCEEAMAVLQNDNEQLEQEKSALKERLKQLTKNKLVDDLMQKKISGSQRTSGLLSKNSILILFSRKIFPLHSGPTMDGRMSPQRQLSSPSTNDGNIISTASEHEVSIDVCLICRKVDLF
jgi:hypothetical protein